MRRPVTHIVAPKAQPVSRPEAVNKILPLVAIADAHRIVCQALKEIISHDGRFNPVIAVATGREFLEATEGQAIAVSIICWSFQDMTGGDVLFELKRRNSKMRVIIYADDGNSTVQEAVRLGAWGFVSRRIETARLLDTIATVVSGRPSFPNLAPQPFATPSLACLTERERTLLSALAKGWSNQQIAEQLGISRNTVKYHLKNLYDKLGVDNRTMAVVLLHGATSDGRCST